MASWEALAQRDHQLGQWLTAPSASLGVPAAVESSEVCLFLQLGKEEVSCSVAHKPLNLSKALFQWLKKIGNSHLPAIFGDGLMFQ